MKNKITQTTYSNRYGDKYTFTLLDDGNIQWDGEFRHCRMAWPNDYTKAYTAYLNFGGEMNLKEFKEEVHRSIYDENNNYVGPCDVARVYGPLVKSNPDMISMVDPSGGPYLTEDMEFMGKIIKEFKSNETGFLIITQ